MWTSKNIDEIQGFINFKYRREDERLIGIVCGNVKDPEFHAKYRHLLPTFNFSSENLVDFFWIGSDDGRQKIDDKLDINKVNYSEEVRVPATIELSNRLGKGLYYLLSGFKLVVLPVKMGEIMFREGVVINFKKLAHAGMEPLDSFHALLEYASMGGEIGREGIERSQKNFSDGLYNAEGITEKMCLFAKSVGKEISTQTIASSVMAVATIVGHVMQG